MVNEKLSWKQYNWIWNIIHDIIGIERGKKLADSLPNYIKDYLWCVRLENFHFHHIHFSRVSTITMLVEKCIYFKINKTPYNSKIFPSSGSDYEFFIFVTKYYWACLNFNILIWKETWKYFHFWNLIFLSLPF
jgi:hypothetical protein